MHDLSSWPKLVLPDSNHGSISHRDRLTPSLEWGPLQPPNSSLPGVRWGLMVSGRVNGSVVAVKRIVMVGMRLLPFRPGELVDNHLGNAEVELRMCRMCTNCGGTSRFGGGISSGWRRLKGHIHQCALSRYSHYNTSGVCTQPQLLRVHRGDVPSDEHERTACSTQQMLNLQGSWAADGTRFHHESCELPSWSSIRSRLAGATDLRLLFVGDSTLEELALLVAHAAGYQFEDLAVRECGNGSNFRHFDATSTPQPNTHYASHSSSEQPDCGDNHTCHLS